MKTVNTPKSFQGNIVRYSVYLVIYLFLYACIYQVIHIARVNWLIDIPILIFVLLGLFFYTRRYNKEQRYFEKKTEITLASDYKLIVGATILLIAFRLLIAYFQFKKYVPFTRNQLFYLQHENNDLFWLLIIYQGLFLSVMQQFLGIGFFFNYFFRKQTFFHAMVGILMSALFFAFLNLQFSLLWFIINFAFGYFFALFYLYSQSFLWTIYFAILNSIFWIILL